MPGATDTSAYGINASGQIVGAVNVLVDIGARRSQVVIGRGREISFIKPIDIGGFHFHEAVSRKLGITMEEAESLRRRLIETGEPVDPAARRDPVRQAVFDATRSPMEELGREISLCLRYYSVTFRGHRPTKLRLIGGEACDPQLQSLLNAALVIPVEIGRPLFSVNTSRMKPSDRRGSMCEWALALGLSLRTTQEHFGARDGRPRDAAPVSPPPPAAEVVDLSAAVKASAADTAEHFARLTAAAKAPAATVTSPSAAETIAAAAPVAPAAGVETSAAPAAVKSAARGGRKERSRA